MREVHLKKETSEFTDITDEDCQFVSNQNSAFAYVFLIAGKRAIDDVR